MRKKAKVDYSRPHTSSWRYKADDAFLAGFRGRPCEICGATIVFYNGQNTRSMGHHLAEKGQCTAHRYNPLNIVVLCANHHGHHARDISPHSDNTGAVAAFYQWLRDTKPEQYKWFMEHRNDGFDHSWTFKDAYINLGGEISGDLIKDQKPVNHAALIRGLEQ